MFYDLSDGTSNLLTEHINYLRNNHILLFKRAYEKALYKNNAFIKPYGLNLDKRYNNLFERGIIHLMKKGFLSPKYIRLFLSDISDWSIMDNKSAYTNDVLFSSRLMDCSKVEQAHLNWARQCMGIALLVESRKWGTEGFGNQ